MTKTLFASLLVLLLLPATLTAQSPLRINVDVKRSDELRKEIWQSNNKDFTVTAVPEKWKNESAVIIAMANVLSYRKAPLINTLNYNSYMHRRIRLQDTKALEEYAEFTIPSTGAYGSTRYEFYAGFKVIKADGREIEVPLSEAVKAERRINQSSRDEYKLAIPNLEIGDILDYYMAQDRTITLYSKYHSFDPVIFELNENYPIMKRTISFEVLRRCYINAVSLNGAPQLKFTEDAARDKALYFLEDSNREAVKDTRWLFPYRDLPSIKFKVSYASAAVANLSVGFLGEPGVIKSSVTTKEVKDLVSTVFYSTSYYQTTLKAAMNKTHKGVKDQDKLARDAYYRLRNIMRVSNAENNLLNDGNDNPDGGALSFLSSLSGYYRSKKIKHDVLIGIPRNISALNDLILENELTFMIKVNTPNPFYIGRYDNHGIPGELDPDLQGQEVYSANGLVAPSDWVLLRAVVPVESSANNVSDAVHVVTISDLEEGLADANITHKHSGANRAYFQNLLMDPYDYLDEENTRVKPTGKVAKLTAVTQKKKTDFMSRRNEEKNKRIQENTKEDFPESLDTTRNLKIVQPGRFDDTPTLTYTFDASFKGITKRVGNNYLVNIGQLVAWPSQVKAEERTRQFNIFMPYARTFKNRLELTIPEGYTAQGLDKLTRKVDNSSGGFSSSARMENGKLIVETQWYYKSNYEPVKNWAAMLEFLDAAFDMSQQQVLLQKK
jgi:hypothetical protein